MTQARRSELPLDSNTPARYLLHGLATARIVVADRLGCDRECLARRPPGLVSLPDTPSADVAGPKIRARARNH